MLQAGVFVIRYQDLTRGVSTDPQARREPKALTPISNRFNYKQMAWSVARRPTILPTRLEQIDFPHDCPDNSYEEQVQEQKTQDPQTCERRILHIDLS